MAIQIRRGTDAQWEAGKRNIVVGEPAITTDTERAFIGTGSGTYVELATIGDTDATITDIKDNAFIHRTESGAIASFSDGSDMPMDSLIADINPVQSGSGDPSPTNVRPISGWNAVNVENDIFLKRCIPSTEPAVDTPISTVNGITVTYKGSGTYHISGTATAAALVKFPIQPITTQPSTVTTKRIRLNNTAKANQMSIIFYYDLVSSQTDTWIFSIQNRVSGYIALANKTIEYIGFSANAGYTFDITCRPEFVDTDNQQTYHITLPSTVYGGTLNVTTGVLTITKFQYAFSGNETFLSNSAWGDYAFLYNTGVSLVSSVDAKSHSICSHLSLNAQGAWETLTPNHFMIAGGSYIGLGYDGTETELKAWLTAQKNAGTPVQVVELLATPQTVQLTPAQVQTLLGQNNVWADSGDVEVKYKANASLTIEEIINAITSLGGNV